MAADTVVAPKVENGQQINVNKDFVDNAYKIYTHNAKECKFHKINVNKDVVDNTYEIYIYNAKEPSANIL